MNETKTINRGWVKNAAIIFLVILLILTFFSNTIMNRSLPEVAGSYAQSGAITTRIRGSGAVEANETYEVQVSQAREVQSVAVRVGDEINVGDILIYLSGEDSDELAGAQDELYNLRLAYNKAVIQATGSDYAAENRNIELAREKLTELEAERDEIYVSDDAVKALKTQLDAAEEKVKNAQKRVDAAQEEVDDIQLELDELGGLVEETEGNYTPVQTAKKTLDDAKTTLSAKELKYGDIYSEIESFARSNRGSSSLDVYMLYLYETDYDYAVSEGAVAASDVDAWKEAYEEITAAKDAVEDAQNTYNNALDAYYDASVSGNESKYNKIKKRLNTAKDTLNAEKKALSAAENSRDEIKKEYDEADADLTKYKDAAAAVKTQRQELDNLIFSLSETQKDDLVNAQITDLDLQSQQRAITRKQEEIAKMQAEGDGSELSSSVAGVVRSINVSAGNTASPNTALITIDVTDRGYRVSFSVTTEQARNIQVGTQGEVSTNYWSNISISATLAAIRTDPDKPSTNKLLVFDVDGDITAGDNLTISVGQKSQNYETTVPNSAIKSDSNGDFVLVVQAKSSPLSTRYIATRVDVTILASDDVNTAVSGGVSTSDFVITTSTKPIESGMQVRMPD